MSDPIKINGKTITPPESSSCATSLLVVAQALYAAENGLPANRTEIKTKDWLTLQAHIESAELWLNCSIECIGQLMTDISYEEIDTHALKNLGYLIAGLAELEKLVRRSDGLVPAPGKEGL